MIFNPILTQFITQLDVNFIKNYKELYVKNPVNIAT